MRLAAGSMNNANETNSSRPSAKPNTHLYASLVKDVWGSYYGAEAVCTLIMSLIDLGFPFLERLEACYVTSRRVKDWNPENIVLLTIKKEAITVCQGCMILD